MRLNLKRVEKNSKLHAVLKVIGIINFSDCISSLRDDF